MALASFEGFERLQARLKADPTLQASALGNPVRVYQRNPPEGTPTYPFILLRWVVGIPVVALGALDVWTEATYDVLVVNRSNEVGSVKAIANRIDEVLNRASGTTTDGQVFFCFKAPSMSEIATTDPPAPGGGARVQNLGRSWRLVVKA